MIRILGGFPIDCAAAGAARINPITVRVISRFMAWLEGPCVARYAWIIVSRGWCEASTKWRNDATRKGVTALCLPSKFLDGFTKINIPKAAPLRKCTAAGNSDKIN